MQQLAEASAQWPGMALVLGHPRRGDEPGVLFNSATLLMDGQRGASYD